MAADQPPATSVILPAFREPALQTCIDRILTQECDETFEVVVCVSVDSRAELPTLNADPRLHVLAFDERVPAATARNRAVRASRGRLLVFTDADAVVEPGWLAALIRASEDTYCVAGSVLNGTPESGPGTVEYLVEFLDLHPDRPPATLWHGATCNLLVPRSLWDELGPFPEDLDGGEDTLLTIAARAHGLFRFAPDAVVTHRNRTRWSHVIAHQISFGRFTARLGRRSPYKWRPLVRYTLLAPIATFGRLVSVYVRAGLWGRGSRWRALVLSPGVVVVLVGWGWGLAAEGVRLDAHALMDSRRERAGGHAPGAGSDRPAS